MIPRPARLNTKSKSRSKAQNTNANRNFRTPPPAPTTITTENLNSLINVVGISERAEILALRDNLPAPWSDVWATVGRLKGLAQWKAKLRAMGAPTDEVGHFSTIKDVGDMLFRRLSVTGVLCESPLQNLPKP